MKRVYLLIAIFLGIMPVFAQQINNYTYKLDSVCYGSSAKEEFRYDSRLNCAEIKTLITSVVPNVVYAKKEFIYDDENRVVKTDYFWDEGYGREIHEYTYNESGLMVEDLLTQCDVFGYTPEIKYKYTYEYDEDLHRTVARGFSYYHGAWEERYHTIFEYENDLLMKTATYYASSTTPDKVTTYTYNEQGLCVEVNQSNTQKTIYTYNESGLCTSRTILKRAGTWEEEWTEASKRILIYDEYGNCITSDSQVFEPDPQHVQYNYIYDLSITVSETAGFNDFVDFGIQSGYTPKNVFTSYVMTDPEEGTTTNPITYHYSGFSGVDEVAAQQLLVWPNPASDILHVGTGGLVEVYTPDGRLMLLTETLETIRVSRLSQGCYLLRVTTPEGKQQTQRFVKE